VLECCTLFAAQPCSCCDGLQRAADRPQSCCTLNPQHTPYMAAGKTSIQLLCCTGLTVHGALWWMRHLLHYRGSDGQLLRIGFHCLVYCIAGPCTWDPLINMFSC